VTFERLGRYRIIGKLPSGGMAEVFLGMFVGPDGFRRLVAIKRIRPELDTDPKFQRMFADEASIASRLTHSNIAQVYDFAIDDGPPYIVMEYVEGKDLRGILHRCSELKRPLPYPMALYVALKSAEGLHFVHSRRGAGRPLGIVHRDISPQNIMVTHSGEVKILDFGVAKATHRLTETQSGVIKGKYAYMSPEQIKGGDVDCRSDIFSLGVVLWESLTQKRLFAGRSDLEIARNVTEKEVPLIEKVRVDLPTELNGILQKALARSVDERYRSMQEFRDDLSLFMMTNNAYPTPDQVADFVYDLFPLEMESLRQGEHFPEGGQGVVNSGAPPCTPTDGSVGSDESSSTQSTASVAGGRSGMGRRPEPESQEETEPLLDLPLIDGNPSNESPGEEAPGSGSMKLRLILAGLLGLAMAALVIGAIYRHYERRAPVEAAARAHMEQADLMAEAPDVEALQELLEQVQRPLPQVEKGKPAAEAVLITMHFDVEPPYGYVLVDGKRFEPGECRMMKVPGQPMVVEVVAAEHQREKRIVEAADGAYHTFMLKETGLITFLVSPGDAEVEVNGTPAIGTRKSFGWIGSVGETARIRITKSGYETYEETIPVIKANQIRTYVLKESGSSLISAVSDALPRLSSSKSSEELAREYLERIPQAPRGEKRVAPEVEGKQHAAPVEPEKKDATGHSGSGGAAGSGAKAVQSPADTEGVQAQKKPSSPAEPAELERAGDSAEKGTKGSIKVTARPYAEVFFKGKSWGRTPTTLDLDAGEHQILLKHPLGAHTCNIQLKSGESTNCYFDFATLESE